MEFPFKTLHEFNDYFKDEAFCYQFLESQRWGDKQYCPHCGSMKTPYTVKARGKFKDIPSYRCSERACDLPFTVRTKSIFEGSKVELRKWLQAAYEITTSKKGISSVELGIRIGVSQKTAWFMNHRIREMLNEPLEEKLEGIVEVDETYIGGKLKNKHVKVRKANAENEQLSSVVNKTGVMALLAREGKVTAEVINGSLKDMIKERVKKVGMIVTDGLQAYKGLDKTFLLHEVVNHRENEYVRGDFHTNTVEGFFSILKRGIYGIYHQVSRQHLNRYCAEFTTRYNNRRATNIDLFLKVIQKSSKDRIKYSVLTGAKREIKVSGLY